MLTALALIFLAGLSMAAIFRCLRLPRVIGMLVTGILLGPYVLDLLDPSILGISSELRQMALIIILIKAGLSLRLSDLRTVGRPALLMAFVPALMEVLAFVLLAPGLLGITRVEAAVMGVVLGAVSPAIVVPKMVQLMEDGCGTDKHIPQMVLAGASLDDVFVIVLFSTFLGMAQGGSATAAGFLGIPTAILCGVMLGALTGWLLATIFETAFVRQRTIRNSLKVLLVLGCAFLLYASETWLGGVLPLSGLLAVMSMACVLQRKSVDAVSRRLSEKFGKLWLAAEVILFVLVGTAVDIRYTLEAGPAAAGMILLALLFRSVGVLLCLLGTPLNRRERLFCVIAYLPKATVQAAIGAVPLSLGLPCGGLVLSTAVLAILMTAPLGALGMELTCRRCLRITPSENRG